MGRPKKLPAFQFYPGDWMKDHALRSVSVAARGLWIDLLCLLFDCDRRGYLTINGCPPSDEQIARMVGLLPAEATHLLTELENSGVLSRNDHGIVYSRRMVRDEKIRKANAKNGRAGGNPNLKKRDSEIEQKSNGNFPENSPKSTPENEEKPPGNEETIAQTEEQEEDTPIISDNRNSNGNTTPGVKRNRGSSVSTSVLTTTTKERELPARAREGESAPPTPAKPPTPAPSSTLAACEGQFDPLAGRILAVYGEARLAEGLTYRPTPKDRSFAAEMAFAWRSRPPPDAVDVDAELEYLRVAAVNLARNPEARNKYGLAGLVNNLPQWHDGGPQETNHDRKHRGRDRVGQAGSPQAKTIGRVYED